MGDQESPDREGRWWFPVAMGAVAIALLTIALVLVIVLAWLAFGEDLVND